MSLSHADSALRPLDGLRSPDHGEPVDPAKVAVAHRPAAGRVERPGRVAPVAWGGSTGIVGTTPTLALTRSGAAFLALRSGGVARSIDDGLSWSVVRPPATRGDTHAGGEHGYVWVDPATDRVFYVTWGQIRSGGARRFFGYTSGSYLSFSDDDGATWTHSVVGLDTWDWPKILAGKPVSSTPGGYRNIVYFHASAPFILGPLRKVYKSLDGGRTWAPTRTVASDGLEPGYGVVGPDGTLFMDEVYSAGIYAGRLGSPYPYRREDQGRLRLVISRDEGDTWEHVVVPGASAALSIYGIQRVAVDDAGNVYVVWADDRDGLPYLSISRDGGRTWSRRLMVAPPGVRRAHYIVSIAAREGGHIAISYLGSGQNWGGPSVIYWPDLRPYDGYITECFDALADDPVLFTGRVNPPDEPLMPRLRIADGAGEGLGVTFGPDGSPWATFPRVVRPFSPGPAVLKKTPATELYVGRLRTPRART